MTNGIPRAECAMKAGFRGAGILPAAFLAYPHGKSAGGTPAPQEHLVPEPIPVMPAKLR
jgi:hypothetical protein